MGQYYKAVLLNKKGNIVKALKPMDLKLGQKLMEHSWIGNEFMLAVENEIHKFSRKGVRLVWAGDYADIMKINDETLYDSSYEFEEKPTDTNDYGYRFIVNHTTKEYIDKKHLVDDGEEGWYVHPLSLLTAIGNEKGSGYRGNSCKELVGKWAGNEISVIKRITNYKKKGYKELTVTFKR